MQKQLFATAIIILFPFLFVSCVSSILKDKPPSFSTEIKLNDPAEPFKKTQTSVYPSWKNPRTGNVIAIASDCSDANTTTRTSLHQLIEGSLENAHLTEQQNLNIQNRPCLMRNISAELDGHPIEVVSVSFKKKSCGYVSSLSGKKGSLQTDRAQFDQFLNDLSFE